MKGICINGKISSLPEWDEEQFSRRRVQSVRRNVECLPFFNAADPGQLISSFGHVVYVDGLTEVVADLHQTAEADGTEAEIVANIGHKSHDFSFV